MGLGQPVVSTFTNRYNMFGDGDVGVQDVLRVLENGWNRLEPIPGRKSKENDIKSWLMGGRLSLLRGDWRDFPRDWRSVTAVSDSRLAITSLKQRQHAFISRALSYVQNCLNPNRIR